jgi:phosphoglycerate dehydrogenase-like enzyme
VPGIEALAGEAELRFAPDTATLRQALDGAEILFGWSFNAENLRDAWDCTGALRWIHWSGAGVDALMFPELVTSAITLTNTRGVYDRAMAEYVLGLIIAFAKRFPESMTAQAERRWQHKLTERIEGQHALIVGAGSIGREIARLLRAAGMTVAGVGRAARAADPDFGAVHAYDDLNDVLGDADYVIGILPLTEATQNAFGAAQFAAMKPTARFINMGRGPSVDEAALDAALEAGEIAGAGLDVFVAEPLPAESPLWSRPDVIVSPHMSGDYYGHEDDVAALFIDNYHRYRAGEPLRNVIDKQRGFAAVG